MNLSVAPNPRITFAVRYRDDDLMVVDKPAGVPAQPGLAHERDTLLNGLFARVGAALQNLGRSRDFGLLHRLDRDASGLVLVALRPRAYDALRTAFEQRQIEKSYWAVVSRPPSRAQGVIRRPIAESRTGPKRARISSRGKEAITTYAVRATSPAAALLCCQPITGRLHQIRVHLASIGCPILGDRFYAPAAVARAAPRLALHAFRLVFRHPTTGVPVDVRSPWPRDLSRLLARVGLPRPDPQATGSQHGREQIRHDRVGDQEPRVGQSPPSL